METMNLLDITIRYFNVIVFVLCVLFGMISLFASWIAWREIHRKNNIVRSVLAAYNIAEETVEKGRTPVGDLQLDPAVVETVFNSLQEILNAIYGEMTGKPTPSQEDRGHGSRRIKASRARRRLWERKGRSEKPDVDEVVPNYVSDEDEHRHHAYHP